MTGANGTEALRYNQWPKDEEDELRKYWEVDGLSAGVIGVMMAKSRSAVIGKVHRLGLAKRRTMRALPPGGSRLLPKAKEGRKQTNFNFSIGRQASRKRKPPAPPQYKPIELAHIVPLNGEGITILDLRKEHCHAVVKGQTQKELARYCGLAAVEGESYCADHYIAFHQPSRPRVR